MAESTARKAARRRPAAALTAAPTARRPRAERLDELIHQRSRLAIVSALAAADRMSFSDLKGLLGLSDGNLSVHARKLEEAGYLRCAKSFSDRTPLTEYSLTAKGRAALERYLGHMEAIIAASRAAAAAG